MTFPVLTSLVRINGSVYLDSSVLKNAATKLGEQRLSFVLPDDVQLAEVKRWAEEFIVSLHVDIQNRKILIPSGGSPSEMKLGISCGLAYNKEEIIIKQDGCLSVNALLRQPFRAAKPWAFGFARVCPAAYDATEGRCVPQPLAWVLKRTLDIEETNND